VFSLFSLCTAGSVTIPNKKVKSRYTNCDTWRTQAFSLFGKLHRK
jgi:hypothetical protein